MNLAAYDGLDHSIALASGFLDYFSSSHRTRFSELPRYFWRFNPLRVPPADKLTLECWKDPDFFILKPINE